MVEIRKNVRVFTCLACNRRTSIEKDARECSFDCPGCGNEIYIDAEGDFSLLGKPEKAEDEPDDLSGNDPVAEIPTDDVVEEKEETKGNPFSLFNNTK